MRFEIAVFASHRGTRIRFVVSPRPSNNNDRYESSSAVYYKQRSNRRARFLLSSPHGLTARSFFVLRRPSHRRGDVVGRGRRIQVRFTFSSSVGGYPLAERSVSSARLRQKCVHTRNAILMNAAARANSVLYCSFARKRFTGPKIIIISD